MKLLVFIFLFGFSAAGWAGPGQSAAATTSTLNRWGIETVALRRTAGGSLLDYRFRVRDVEKSKPLFDPKAKPFIIDPGTGAKFTVPEPPQIGPLRPTKNIEAGKIYYILFANPGGMIKPGTRVTVVIGDFRAEAIIVR